MAAGCPASTTTKNTLSINQPAEIEGLASCLDYFKALAPEDPVSAKIQAAYDKQFPRHIPVCRGKCRDRHLSRIEAGEAASRKPQARSRTRSQPSIMRR